MAELNFGLLNPPGSQSIGNAFVSGMDQAAAARAQENQNALAQYTLSKAKRDDEMQNQLYSAVRQPGFKLDIGTAMQFGAPGLAAYKAQGEAGKTQAETEYKRAQTGAIPGQIARDKAATGASNATQQEARQKFINQATRDLAANPSDDNIRAYGQDAVLKELYTQEEADRATDSMLAIPPDQRAARFRQAGAAAAAPPPQFMNVPSVGLVNPGTREVIMPAVAPAVADPTTVAEYNFAKLHAGGGFPGTYNEFLVARARAGRTPPQPRAEQPPVAVIDPVTGRPVLVSREEAVRGRMTPATVAPDIKPLTEAQTIKLRTDVGKDYKNASTALAQMDDVLASAALVRAAPGLDAATGYTGMLPSFTGGAAAQAETRLANLRGKITAAAKAAASMGGSIGPIATAEWKILSDQIAVLNEVKGKGPLLEQISGLETQLIGAAERIRDAYEKTRGEDFARFPQFRDLPAAKQPGGTPAAPQGTGGFKYLGTEGTP